MNVNTSEGTDELTELTATSSDGKAYVFSVTYEFKIKEHVNPTLYQIKELMPLVARACREVIGNHTADELTEDNFKTLRGEMFRAVNENIDPLVVAVPLLTLDRLGPVER